MSVSTLHKHRCRQTGVEPGPYEPARTALAPGRTYQDTSAGPPRTLFSGRRRAGAWSLADPKSRLALRVRRRRLRRLRRPVRHAAEPGARDPSALRSARPRLRPRAPAPPPAGSPAARQR